MSKSQLIPGPDHPITITPTAERVTVSAGSQVLASTDNALTLQESTYPAVQYVPLADVDPTVLTRSDHETYCPYKGAASYYHLTMPDGELSDVVWSYESPYDAVAPIAGHVAFYPDKVAIEVG